jgi:nicotinamidase-related amidase
MSGSRSVLLVMDFQHGVVEPFGDSAVLDAAGRAVKAARASGIPVMFVRVAFRPAIPRPPRATRSSPASLSRATR